MLCLTARICERSRSTSTPKDFESLAKLNDLVFRVRGGGLCHLRERLQQLLDDLRRSATMCVVSKLDLFLWSSNGGIPIQVREGDGHGSLVAANELPAIDGNISLELETYIILHTFESLSKLFDTMWHLFVQVYSQLHALLQDQLQHLKSLYTFLNIVRQRLTDDVGVSNFRLETSDTLFVAFETVDGLVQKDAGYDT